MTFLVLLLESMYNNLKINKRERIYDWKMKPFFKSCILKLFLLFLLHNTLTKPAEVTALLVTEKLVALTGLSISLVANIVSHYVGSFAFIHQQKHAHVSLKRSKTQD